MAQPALNPRQVRFGLYELDLESRELRKSGVRIKLHEQPFQILALLLERPGEIVTREELQKRLWTADTYVDFDLSLNSAVKKLRQALNDDSDNPRFIETLYRRGYRFVGPVNGNSKSEATELQPSTASQPTLITHAPVLTFPGKEEIPRKRRIAAASAVVVLLAAAMAYWFAPQRPVRALGYTQITHDGRLKGKIVTDGQRLYFNQFDQDRFVVAQVSVLGGETVPVPMPFLNVELNDIAPDGSALLVTEMKKTESSPTLWIVPLPAGAPRRVGDASSKSATWSPEGKEIVFSKGSDIYLVNVDGTGAHRIGTAPGPVSDLRFSPDGQRLRFVVFNFATASQLIWEIRRDGTGLRQLMPDWNSTLECCGSWTPDGKYFVFQESRRGSDNIWALREKSGWLGRTSQPQQLTSGPLHFRSPALSKDGKKIFLLGSQPRGELLRFDPKLGLVPYLGSKSAIDLAFSPDGQWVAYVSIPDFTLWRSRLDGSEPLQLTSSSMFAELPRWSPDGEQIVFMGRTEDTNFHAYIVSSKAAGLRELIPGSEIGFDPGWMPDNKSVVLSQSDSGYPKGVGISIFEIDSKKLTPLPGSENLFSPRPSPDGKYIAAVTRGSERIVLFDVARQSWSDLTVKMGPIGYPSWSHDGQYLYFDTMFADDPGIFRVRLADRKIEEVTSLKDVPLFLGNFGLWTGLAPDDSPLFTRDISSQEIYALDWDAP